MCTLRHAKFLPDEKRESRNRGGCHDGYADSLPPPSPPPAEDAAAHTGAHVAGAVTELANKEGAQSLLRWAPPTVVEVPTAVGAAAGVAAEQASAPTTVAVAPADSTVSSACI